MHDLPQPIILVYRLDGHIIAPQAVAMPTVCTWCGTAHTWHSNSIDYL